MGPSGNPLPLSALDRHMLAPAGTAMFLDFDGTLADFADDPAEVFLPKRELQSLASLERTTGGAVAVISGRAMRDLDRMLAPLSMPLAGVHGLERRNTAGKVISAEVDEGAIEAVRRNLAAFAEKNPGVLVETKPGAVVLHYRRRPDLAGQALAVAEAAAAGRKSLKILRGKMVVEIKAGDITKANAIADFMTEPPFAGRRPVFAGDDVTDEDGFVRMAKWGGISIKIGAGETVADFRADDIDDFRAWLGALADAFEEAVTGAGA